MEEELKLEEKIERLSKIIEKNPEDADAYFDRGNIYLTLERYDKVITNYNKVIELEPNLAPAYNNRGNVFYYQKLYDKAILDYTKAIELEPDYVKAYCNRGNTFHEIQEYDKAVKDFNKAIELEPDYADAYYSKGCSFYKLKQYDRAVLDYTKSIELNPDNFKAYFNRGNIYRESNQYDKALLDYAEAIKINPHYSNAFINRGLTLLNDPHKAIPDFIRAIEIDPDIPEAYLNRGLAFYRIEEYDKAIQDFNKVIKLNPNSEKAYYNRGCLFHKLKQYKNAIEDYSRTIEINPEYISAYNNRSILYAYTEQYEKGIKDLDKVVKFEPDNVSAYNNRGNIYNLINKPELAILDYNRIIKIKPDHSVAYNNRGNTFYNLSKYNEAINDYNKAIKLDSQNTNAYNNRGLAYCLLEKWADSAISFMKGKTSALDFLTKFNEVKKSENVFSYIINFDPFFKETTNFVKEKNEYKKIYINILKSIALLYVKNETTASHYTKKATAAQLLFKSSKFRLNSTITANDPQEGETLLKYFKLEESEKHKKEESQRGEPKHDYQAFIGCFTFNHESLNQFRLYGKESDKEATGISLVLNKDFFNEKMDIGLLSNCFLKDNDKENANVKDERTQKYALYRCIYVDPKTHKVISLGHKEEYSFYRENIGVSSDEISTYNKEINKIKSKVTNQLNKLDKSIKTGKDLDKNIICELLLPLRYLVKHVAYKEEQECRIFDIKDLKDKSNEIKFTPDYAQMFIEYQPITKYVKKIFFAPKTEGVEIFKKAIEQKELKIDCKLSTHPFS
ncbi:tetratricopeptide repeat protein [uncultured Bacteroides sp.]|uniref:tetratricopeptide repeat protein n=1 Tax=uncultured Bacteroides sp. TaxID=162156 RepID=UPI002AAC2FC1|nr:tetratricopeptide repeat protein [uncultured Bacteroides sp.]